MQIKDFILPIFLTLSQATTIMGQTATIESDIHSAYNHIYKHGSMSKIDSMVIELQQQAGNKSNRYLTYWSAYARYERAIATLEYYNYDKEKYSTFKRTGTVLLDESIKEMEDIKEKTSEDYALIAIMKNASLPFSNPIRIPFLSKEVKRCALKAVEMDSLNLRGWLALAILDRHTPEVYGGGKQFEELFLKILTLEDRHSDFPYDPSWGKDEAYVNLVSYYWDSNRQKAAALLSKAMELYPDNHRLQAYQKSL